MGLFKASCTLAQLSQGTQAMSKSCVQYHVSMKGLGRSGFAHRQMVMPLEL